MYIKNYVAAKEYLTFLTFLWKQKKRKLSQLKTVFIIFYKINNVYTEKRNLLGIYPFFLANHRPKQSKAIASSATMTPAAIAPPFRSPTNPAQITY